MTNRSRTLVGLAGLALMLAAAAPASAGPKDSGYAKAFSCSACHGWDGASRTDTVPVLAGMQAWYLKKAIQDYASGKRPAAEMEPYAKMVLQLGVDDVAAYFAKQPKPGPVAADPAAVERGRAAAAQCAVCHGPAGKGDPAKGVPDLTGQPAGYLKTQMLLFKADKRSAGDPTLSAIKALMKAIPDAQYADLAAYFSSQR
ncbi:MAG: c-type cytochrome [candidate division NC10 bacterium]